MNYTSPFDNTFVGTAAVQTLSISAAGLSNVNAVVGAGNVTVASNGILNGAVLGSITGSAVGSLNAGTTEIAVATLTPGFALQNSNANALTLAAASAIAGAGLGGPGIALDIQQSGLNEYSPHGNVSAFGGSISQSITVSTAGIANVGAAAGAGNVQAAHSLILYSAGSTINLSVVTQ